MTSRSDVPRRDGADGVLAFVLVGLLAAAAVTGCDRTYLTSSHGRAYRAAFAAQTVNPDRRTDAKAVNGLDSQEAAIISGTYRKGLSPAANETPGQTQLLTYSRGGGREAAPVPSSSVPSAM